MRTSRIATINGASRQHSVTFDDQIVILDFAGALLESTAEDLHPQAPYLSHFAGGFSKLSHAQTSG